MRAHGGKSLAVLWSVLVVLSTCAGAGAVSIALSSGAGASGGACFAGIGVQILPEIFEGTTSTPVPNPPSPGDIARVGDTVDYLVDVYSSPITCPFSNGTVTLSLPSSGAPTPITLATGVSIPTNGSMQFDATAISASNLYTVANADLGTNGAPPSWARAFAAVSGKGTTSGGTLQTASASANFDIGVIHPETTLTKSVNHTSGRSPLSVTYTFEEANVSADPATPPDGDHPALLPYDAIDNVSVLDTDPNCTPAFVSSSDSDTAHLNPGATWTYSCGPETLTNTGTTPKTYSDQATATGDAVGDGRPAGTPASLGAPHGETSNTVVVTVYHPHTTLTESALPTSGRTPLSVTFTYHETNDGSDPISGVTVTGSVCGTATYQSGDTNTNHVLDPGETWVFTCTKSLTNSGTTPLTLTDDGSASGTDTNDGLAAPAESASAQVVIGNPHTTLTESASPTSGRTPLPVTFTYHEANDGSDPITGVTVTGSVCGTATYQSGDTNTNHVLDPGETWVFTCTKTLTNSGTTPLTYTDDASASGTDTSDGLAAPAESASAAVTVGNPHTTLTESALPTSGRSPLSVTFTYHEANDGSDPISGVTVTGSVCGAATYQSGDTNTNHVLDPGETWVFTCTKTLTNSGTTSLTYTDDASASGTDTVDHDPAPPESASAGVTVQNPHTTLTESASPMSGRSPLPVTFTYDEANDGSDPISGVTVTGSVCGTATYQSGDTNTNHVLDPGETWVFTCTKTLTNSGTTPLTFTDTAGASGTDTVDTLAAPPESASAGVTVLVPHTTLTETASPTSGRSPLQVTFTYHEANDGSDPITTVGVTGSACGTATYQSGDTNTNHVLDPGETWVFTCTKTFTTSSTTPVTITDNASASGMDATDGLPAPAESASTQVTVAYLHTTLTESASPTSGAPPLPVTFTYDEHNDGGGAISGVTVTGSVCGAAIYQSGDTNSNHVLDPGETWVFTCTITLGSAGTYTDTASAAGTAVVDGQAAPAESASVQVTVSSFTANLTPGFWKNHSAATTSHLPQTLGGFTVGDFPTARQILSEMGCGRYGALNCMAGMLLSADLNLAQGGSTCIVTNGTILAANMLLSAHSYAGPNQVYSLGATDQTAAMHLHDVLSAYNIDGVPTC